jgi:mono/diheme cytochrome c family protein
VAKPNRILNLESPMARRVLRWTSNLTAAASPLLAALLLGVGVTPAHAQSPAPAAAQADTAVVTPETVEAGRKIFHGRGTCHACHGDQLQGGPVAPSLRGPKWRNIDGTFVAILKRVQGGQPGTVMVAHPGDIDDAQTVQVATYVWAVSQGLAKP